MPDIIERLMSVPYLEGGRTMRGADCWGIVELYYNEVFGIDLDDRADIEPGPKGLATGHCLKSNWYRVDQPHDGDLVVLAKVVNRQRIAGHVGIFQNGSLIHSDKPHGCVCQPITHRTIRTRIIEYLRYKP